MIVLALRTGVRREGLAELKLEDVDADVSAIVVVLKGGRRHRIVLDAESSSALSAWLRWLSMKSVTGGFVFRSLRRGIRGWIVGKRLHVSSINQIFDKVAARAGIDRFFPHLARHAFISWADAAGVPRRRIAAVTGHRELSGLAPYLHDVDAEDDPVSDHLPSLFTDRKP
jgi:integrase